MGAMQATQYANFVHDGYVEIERALAAHLSSNHYPPVSPVFISVAKQAIEKVDQGLPDEVLVMPNGRSKTAADIVAGLHLQPFCSQSE